MTIKMITFAAVPIFQRMIARQKTKVFAPQDSASLTGGEASQRIVPQPYMLKESIVFKIVITASKH